MWIPFQIPAEGMEDHDKARGKVHGLVLLKKHTGDNAVHRMEEAVEQGTVTQKEITEIFINSEHAVAMGDIHQFKGHISSPFHGIFIAAA